MPIAFGCLRGLSKLTYLRCDLRLCTAHRSIILLKVVCYSLELAGLSERVVLLGIHLTILCLVDSMLALLRLAIGWALISFIGSLLRIWRHYLKVISCLVLRGLENRVSLALLVRNERGFLNLSLVQAFGLVATNRPTSFEELLLII